MSLFKKIGALVKNPAVLNVAASIGGGVVDVFVPGGGTLLKGAVQTYTAKRANDAAQKAALEVVGESNIGSGLGTLVTSLLGGKSLLKSDEDAARNDALIKGQLDGTNGEGSNSRLVSTGAGVAIGGGVGLLAGGPLGLLIGAAAGGGAGYVINPLDKVFGGLKG